MVVLDLMILEVFSNLWFCDSMWSSRSRQQHGQGKMAEHHIFEVPSVGESAISPWRLSRWL